jgi:hypothetical protein
MLNYYRRFLPHAAAHQAPLHDVLSEPKVKGSHPITWTPELHKAFEKCKASLSHATLLAHLDTFTPLALVTDASTATLSAMQQQRVKNAWQPLTFYPKKINPEGKLIAAPPPPSTVQLHHLPCHHRLSHKLHALDTTHVFLFASTAEQPSLWGWGWGGDVGTNHTCLANAKQWLGKQLLVSKAYNNTGSNVFSMRSDSMLYARKI